MESENKNLHSISKKPFKIVVLIVFLIFFLFSVSLLFQSVLLKKQLQSKDGAEEQKENELVAKEEEIKLCIEDRAKWGETYKKIFSYSDFGIYSPLFEDKEVNCTDFEYKRNKIIRKSIGFKEEDNNSDWGIIVWELEESTYGLPRLNNNIPLQQLDFPVFDGYENYALSPNWISDRMSNWNEPESLYINKNNIEMHWAYGSGPKSIASVHFEFYNPNSPSNKQAFIVLWMNLKGDLFITDKNDPSIIETKEELKKIADTIDFRLRN